MKTQKDALLATWDAFQAAKENHIRQLEAGESLKRAKNTRYAEADRLNPALFGRCRGNWIHLVPVAGDGPPICAPLLEGRIRVGPIVIEGLPEGTPGLSQPRYALALVGAADPAYRAQFVRTGYKDETDLVRILAPNGDAAIFYGIAVNQSFDQAYRLEGPIDVHGLSVPDPKALEPDAGRYGPQRQEDYAQLRAAAAEHATASTAYDTHAEEQRRAGSALEAAKAAFEELRGRLHASWAIGIRRPKAGGRIRLWDKPEAVLLDGPPLPIPGSPQNAVLMHPEHGPVLKTGAGLVLISKEAGKDGTGLLLADGTHATFWLCADPDKAEETLTEALKKG